MLQVVPTKPGWQNRCCACCLLCAQVCCLAVCHLLYSSMIDAMRMRSGYSSFNRFSSSSIVWKGRSGGRARPCSACGGSACWVIHLLWVLIMTDERAALRQTCCGSAWPRADHSMQAEGAAGGNSCKLTQAILAHTAPPEMSSMFSHPKTAPLVSCSLA